MQRFWDILTECWCDEVGVPASNLPAPLLAIKDGPVEEVDSQSDVALVDDGYSPIAEDASSVACQEEIANQSNEPMLASSPVLSLGKTPEASVAPMQSGSALTPAERQQVLERIALLRRAFERLLLSHSPKSGRYI